MVIWPLLGVSSLPQSTGLSDLDDYSCLTCKPQRSCQSTEQALPASCREEHLARELKVTVLFSEPTLVFTQTSRLPGEKFGRDLETDTKETDRQARFYPVRSLNLLHTMSV